MDAPRPDGYSWSGDLTATDLRSLYAACATVSFSGRLALTDGERTAELTFLGGEPVDEPQPEPQAWSRGTFHIEQKLPDLSGELTNGRELAGTLAEVKPASLWKWIDEFLLSCEVELEQPGAQARVFFQAGKAQRAEVNGQAEPGGLVRLSAWSEGSFRVALSPLFRDQVVPDAATPGDETSDPFHFDFSRTVKVGDQPSVPWPTQLESTVYTPSEAAKAEPEVYIKPTPVQAPEPAAPASTPAPRKGLYIGVAVAVVLLVLLAGLALLFLGGRARGA
jgi:hypothetical protein